LVKAAKINKRNVEELLSGQNTYTLHKPVRKRIRRNWYTVTNIDDVWEIDLAYLSSLSKYNDKYKYLLNVIDIYSRYGWSVTVKDKIANSITAALKSVFQNRKTMTIKSDKGTEVFNATLQYLKRHVVSFHTTHNPDIKVAIIEQLTRPLKTKMYKYFTKKNTYCYLNVINKH